MENFGIHRVRCRLRSDALALDCLNSVARMAPADLDEQHRRPRAHRRLRENLRASRRVKGEVRMCFIKESGGGGPPLLPYQRPGSSNRSALRRLILDLGLVRSISCSAESRTERRHLFASHFPLRNAITWGGRKSNLALEIVHPKDFENKGRQKVHCAFREHFSNGCELGDAAR